MSLAEHRDSHVIIYPVNHNLLHIYKATGHLPEGYATDFIIVGSMDIYAGKDVGYSGLMESPKEFKFSMITPERNRVAGFNPRYVSDTDPKFDTFPDASGVSGIIEVVDGNEQITAYQIREDSDGSVYGKNAKNDLVAFAKFMGIGISNQVMLHLEAEQSGYTPRHIAERTAQWEPEL
jgi:hypothetical protein